MNRLLVIFTGGTIASGFTEGGGKNPNAKTSNRLKESLSSFFAEREVELIYREPWGIPGLDSSDFGPNNWVTLTKIISEELEKGLSAVLILHGTDTMAYSASWLGLCFNNADIPIILTGSQLTLDYMTEDVTSNLRGAAQACFSEVKGVWIYFNWKLIPSLRAHKSHAMHPDAFTAVNSQWVSFNPEWGRIVIPQSRNVSSAPHKDLKTILSLSGQQVEEATSKIGWEFCIPGFKPCLRGDENLLAIVGYGAGNAPSEFLKEIKNIYGAHRPIVMACSQAEGGVKQPSSYANVGIGELAGAGFEVWNQMDYPLEFIQALCCYATLAYHGKEEEILGRYLTKS